MTPASTLEYALLGLLRQQARSGYDLRKMFATTPMGHFSDSPGSIYPALRRLAARGWIAPSAKGGDPRKRQVFTVTRAGTHAFIDWLRQPVTREDIIRRVDELHLRFAFLDGNVERPVTVRFLEDLERELTAYVRELKAHAKIFPPEVRSSTGYLVFTLGVAGYQQQLAWARRVRKQFTEALS